MNDNDENTSALTGTAELPPVFAKSAILPSDMQLHPDFGNPEQLFNMRDWLQKAVETKGAKMKGGGVGMGEADIDIELEGHGYNLRIKPLLR